MVRQRKRRSPIFLVSFVTTVVVLIGVAFVGILLLPSATQAPLVTSHLPTTTPAYSAPWAKYVPSQILQVTFDNFSYIGSLNASAVPSSSLLDLTFPKESVTSNVTTSAMTVIFAQPNATVDLLFMKSQPFLQFATQVASAYSQVLGTKPLVVAAQALTTNSTVFGWLGLLPRDSVVAFSEGSTPAKAAMNLVLEAYNGTIPNILRSTQFRQSLYTVNGTNDHLAFGYQNFTGVVRSATTTLITVDKTSSGVRVSYTVRFNSTQLATDQVSTVRSAYLTANSFYTYDQYVKAVKQLSFGQMETAVALAG